MDALLKLFTAPDTGLNIHIGISAIMEDLQGTETLSAIVDRLGELTRHDDARIRGDACHYLALSGDPAAAAYIKPLLKDEDKNVREVARESLE
jgi:HEAT repeat protein